MDVDAALAALALTNPAAAAIVRNALETKDAALEAKDAALEAKDAALEAKDAVIKTQASALESKDETITTLVSKVTRERYERYAFLRSRSCAADFRRYQKYY